MQKIFTWINVGIVAFLTIYFTSNIIISMFDFDTSFMSGETLMFMSLFFAVLHFGFSMALFFLVIRAKAVPVPKLTRAFVIMNFVSGCLPVVALLAIIAANIVDGLEPVAMAIIYFGYWLLLALYIATLIVFIIILMTLIGNRNRANQANQPMQQNYFNPNQPMQQNNLNPSQPVAEQNNSTQNVPVWNNNAPINNQNPVSLKEEELDRRLEKLIDMYNTGKLSKDEYENLKAKLLEQY